MLIIPRVLACLFVITLITTVAPASGQSDYGTTMLGAGFTGKPFVIEGDVVMETTGLYESIRDYADATNPAWIG